jgi:hypothetical protein
VNRQLHHAILIHARLSHARAVADLHHDFPLGSIPTSHPGTPAQAGVVQPSNPPAPRGPLVPGSFAGRTGQLDTLNGRRSTPGSAAPQLT